MGPAFSSLLSDLRIFFRRREGGGGSNLTLNQQINVKWLPRFKSKNSKVSEHIFMTIWHFFKHQFLFNIQGMPKASLRQPGASGSYHLHRQGNWGSLKGGGRRALAKIPLEPWINFRKDASPQSTKKKKKMGEEKVHTPPTRAGRETHSPSTCLSSAHVIRGSTRSWHHTPHPGCNLNWALLNANPSPSRTGHGVSISLVARSEMNTHTQ